MRGLAVALIALVLAAPALAKPDPGVLKLQKQVAALTVQVQQLQKQAEQNRQLAICYYALNQDTFRIVFLALSSITQALTGSRVPSWDAINRFDDQGACAALNMPRP